MPNKIDTPQARRAVLDCLGNGPVVTCRIGKKIDRTTRQTYPLLRKMERDGLVVRDDRTTGLWHLRPQSGHPMNIA